MRRKGLGEESGIDSLGIFENGELSNNNNIILTIFCSYDIPNT